MLSKMNVTEDSDWLSIPIASLHHEVMEQARAHQLQLTKPPGALGELEEIAVRMAGLQGVVKPRINHPHIIVFAADHGVVEEGVSAFPQAVTAQMLSNFANGGAAINVVAKQIGASLTVVDMGVNGSECVAEHVMNQRVRNGTHNFAKRAAMSRDECLQALHIGKQMVEQAHADGMDFFIAGEMGIGNTTSATALATCMTKLSALTLTGPGAGLNKVGVAHKARVIQQAVSKSKLSGGETLACLSYFGGFEIVAMVGAYLRSAQLGIPMLLDGYISAVAGYYAVKLSPQARDWMLFGHRSLEPGHQHVLRGLQATPILNLRMRLGEGSGAAVAFTIIQSALALHHDMATFSSAGVTGQHI